MDQLSGVVMALQLRGNTCVTVSGQEVWAVPGDVVVDGPGGERKVLHKLDFEQYVKDNNYSAATGDIGAGWVRYDKV